MQTTLWPTAPLARAADPGTCQQAPSAPCRSELQGLVLAIHRSWPGLTDEQLCDLLPDYNRGSVIKRRSELVQAGDLCDSRRRAAIRSGRTAIVWGLT